MFCSPCKQCFPFKALDTFCSPGSSLTTTFSNGILRLTESGKLHELKGRWWDASEAESCADKSVAACEGLAPLELEHLGKFDLK